MEDLLVLAAWHYATDPAVVQIFAVRPGDTESLIPKRFVVMRGDIQAPRILRRSDFAIPHEIWEVPTSMMAGVLSKSIESPREFPRDRWEPVLPPEERPRAVRLDRLRLRNFRCFETKELAFGSGFNVLIGKNGSGKTSVLDALAQIMSQCVHMLLVQAEEVREKLSLKDVRVISTEHAGIPTGAPQYPAIIDAELYAYGEKVSECGWSVTLGESRSERDGTKPVWSGTGKSSSFVNILDFVRLSLDGEHRQVPLPVFAYYRSGRRWNEQPPPSVPLREDTTREVGYTGWQDPARDSRALEQWLANLELIAYQRKTTIAALQAVKRAILESLRNEGFVDVRFDAALGELAAQRADGLWMPFRRLSDGIRNVFGMVADLAVRCAQLNPQLGENATVETSGIVLIDEIDLHLHPTWQRRIVENLRNAFPRIQFVATTHSPLIIQSLRPGELVQFDDTVSEYHRQSCEDILETLMNVEHPQRSVRWLRMKEAAREYYRVLHERRASAGEVEQAKLRLDELLAPFMDDPAYVAFLEMERVAAGLGQEAKGAEDGPKPSFMEQLEVDWEDS